MIKVIAYATRGWIWATRGNSTHITPIIRIIVVEIEPETEYRRVFSNCLAMSANDQVAQKVLSCYGNFNVTKIEEGKAAYAMAVSAYDS